MFQSTLTISRQILQSCTRFLEAAGLLCGHIIIVFACMLCVFCFALVWKNGFAEYWSLNKKPFIMCTSVYQHVCT